MSNDKDGGPAFPMIHNNWHRTGMTMRDYFAAKAMQSMNGRQDYLDAPASVIALDAYALADAMLRAREAA
jgi:hypothetical protein